VPSVDRFLGLFLQTIVVILTLLATLVGRFRSSLVASHTHSRFDIPLVVSTLSLLLILRVRLIASLTTSCVTFRPALSAANADAVLFAKRQNHGSGIFVSPIHRGHHNERSRKRTFSRMNSSASVFSLTRELSDWGQSDVGIRRQLCPDNSSAHLTDRANELRSQVALNYSEGLDGIRSLARCSCFSSRIRLISRTRAMNFCKSCSLDAISASCFKRSP
jgi:hypothetical protein